MEANFRKKADGTVNINDSWSWMGEEQGRAMVASSSTIWGVGTEYIHIHSHTGAHTHMRKGCVWMNLNAVACLCVCVCVWMRTSPPSSYSFLFILIDVLLCVIRPGSCAGCPTKGGFWGPQPLGPSPTWCSLLTPLGGYKNNHNILHTSAPPLLRPHGCCSSPVFIPLFYILLSPLFLWVYTHIFNKIYT